MYWGTSPSILKVSPESLTSNLHFLHNLHKPAQGTMLEKLLQSLMRKNVCKWRREMIEVRSKCISCEKRLEFHIYLPKSKFSFFIITNLKKHNNFWRLCEATLVLFVFCPLFFFYIDISPSSPVEASLILFPTSFNLILQSPFKVDTCIIFYTFLIFYGFSKLYI